MTDFQKTLDLLDAAEERHRYEARHTTQAAREPVTSEQRHEQLAAELATRLRNAQSTWTTFTT